MNTPKPLLPTLKEEERSPMVDVLLEVLAWQEKRIEELEEELLRLKGETTKPNIKPSKMDQEEKPAVKAANGQKRRKTAQLAIDKTIVVQPEVIPEGAVFKGYRDVIIQDIVFERHNICYRLAQYEMVDGGTLSGQLPKELNGSHIGKKLHCFSLYQYHHQHVTQPLLLQQLRRPVQRRFKSACCQNVERFHDEKQALLPAGLLASQTIHADDTGARHQGNNGVCTHIGNEHFGHFIMT